MPRRICSIDRFYAMIVVDSEPGITVMYYPIMASLISKKKGNKLYYYVVESGRVDGKPRIVQQTYLGTADRLADLLKERTIDQQCSDDAAELKQCVPVTAITSYARCFNAKHSTHQTITQS